jgi:hypothetical protein
MPAISYTDWSGGLDRRLSVNSQDANKLWTLKNAYITTGKRIRKRPCLSVVTAGLSGSTGLKAVNGSLYVFARSEFPFTPPVVSGLSIAAQGLDTPVTHGDLERVLYAELFQGFIYAVARYDAGPGARIRHHYADRFSAGVVVTISNAAPGVVTSAGHGLLNGQHIRFTTTGALPDPLAAGNTYFVVNTAADTFEVSATEGGVSINTTTAGSGVHTCITPTYINDANCPHTNGITKAASRIFAPSGENVRYCAVGAARDWTTASDAGFLPAGLEQDGTSEVQACGTFQESLVVLFEGGAQIWSVATDPSANAISKRMYGVGTAQPLSLASFSSDLVFLSPFGFRSMTVQAISSRIDDNDVGVPIDTLVQPDIATTEAVVSGDPVRSYWIPELGQYWAVFDMGTFSKAWVYTFSKSSKIACWSEYIFPVRIEDVTTLSGKVYLRDADNLYEMSATQYTDDGESVSVEVQMAFQDAKQPGINKQVWGADMVTSGTWGLSYKYDPRDDTKQTTPLTISGDTRPGDTLPVDVVTPAIAPVFTHSADEAASIDSLILYFHSLGL